MQDVRGNRHAPLSPSIGRIDRVIRTTGSRANAPCAPSRFRFLQSACPAHSHHEARRQRALYFLSWLQHDDEAAAAARGRSHLERRRRAQELRASSVRACCPAIRTRAGSCCIRWPKPPAATDIMTAASTGRRRAIPNGKRWRHGPAVRHSRPPRRRRRSKCASSKPTAPETTSTSSTRRRTKSSARFGESRSGTAPRFHPTAAGSTSATKPSTERISMIWKTCSVRVASRPATAITSIADSQPVIHAAALRAEAVAAGMAAILDQRLAPRGRRGRGEPVRCGRRVATMMRGDATARASGALMTTSYDAIVIGSGQAGPSLAVRLAAGRHEDRAGRARAPRRHLRQRRLHPDQDAGRQRARRARRAARRRLRRDDRRAGQRRHEGGEGAQGRASSRSRSTASTKWIGGTPEPDAGLGPCPLRRPARGRGRRRACCEAPKIFINVGGRAGAARLARASPTCRC